MTVTTIKTAHAFSIFAGNLLGKLVQSGALSREDAIWLAEETSRGCREFGGDSKITEFFDIVSADMMKDAE